LILDLAQESLPSRDSTRRAEVCIVGAGAAGIVLAVELARHGKRVVLLEGGGPDVEEASQEPYQSEIAGLRHNGIHEGRFRSLGGSTTRWGGQILELDALDFEERPWIEGSGWPIAKHELAAYYARATELEGLAKVTLEDSAVWREAGLTVPEYAGMEPFFTRWCPETNFARLHRASLADDPRVTVWLHANAISPVWEGPRIRGIRARTLGGMERTFEADTFIWAMGGIECSRFFLQPELAQLPWSRRGLVGIS
jgi:glycine/D-amino acid oxidase-like deaminating enzyme